jgi:hypothetical protein
MERAGGSAATITTSAATCGKREWKRQRFEYRFHGEFSFIVVC